MVKYIDLPRAPSLAGCDLERKYVSGSTSPDGGGAMLIGLARISRAGVGVLHTRDASLMGPKYKNIKKNVPKMKNGPTLTTSRGRARTCVFATLTAARLAIPGSTTCLSLLAATYERLISRGSHINPGDWPTEEGAASAAGVLHDGNRASARDSVQLT